MILSFWFESGAEAAIARYSELFPDTRPGPSHVLAADTPAGPEGSVRVFDFTLMGQAALIMECAGRPGDFGFALALTVPCDSQAEIDRLWEGLADGGTPMDCGWIRDRWGVIWQIQPRRMGEWMSDPDRDLARRRAQAMLTMTKIDMAAIEHA